MSVGDIVGSSSSSSLSEDAVWCIELRVERSMRSSRWSRELERIIWGGREGGREGGRGEGGK